MGNRNITLSLPEELIRRTKVVAAERDSSMSALVAELLVQAVGEPTSYEDLWAAEQRAMAAGVLEVGPITWTRDGLHER